MSLGASLLASPLDSLSAKFNAIAFTAWTGEWLQRTAFENLLYGTGIAIALTGAALLIVQRLLVRAGYPPPHKLVTAVCIGLTLLSTLNYFGYFNPNVRYRDYYHRHEFFHYYLGSKYSGELGYSRLYECTAIAEVELGHKKVIQGQEIRDLRAKNLIKPITKTYVLSEPEKCTSHFSKERWDAFKADVKWFRTVSGGNYWINMKKDHGYNPPPVWTMTGKLLSNLGPAGDGLFKWLSSLDILLHLGTLAMLRWAFGWRITAITSIFWGCNTAGNFYWTGGAFLRQDWIFLFISSMCFAKKKRYELAGGAFVWAGLLRIFPLAAGFGWGALIGLHWLKHRTLRPEHKRFIAGCAVMAGVLIPASIAVTGVESYKEFAGHISLHKNTPLTNHMGLENMVVHTWEGRMRFKRDDGYDDSFEHWKQGRIDRKQNARWLFYAVWVGLMAWIVWALKDTKHFWLGLPLSVPLVMSMTNLTCYYYVLFLAIGPLARLRSSVGLALMSTAAGSHVLLAHFYWIDDRYAALSYLFFAMALLPLVAMSRLPTREAIRSWLRTLSRSRPRVEASRAQP